MSTTAWLCFDIHTDTYNAICHYIMKLLQTLTPSECTVSTTSHHHILMWWHTKNEWKIKWKWIRLARGRARTRARRSNIRRIFYSQRECVLLDIRWNQPLHSFFNRYTYTLLLDLNALECFRCKAERDRKRFAFFGAMMLIYRMKMFIFVHFSLFFLSLTLFICYASQLHTLTIVI